MQQARRRTLAGRLCALQVSQRIIHIPDATLHKFDRCVDFDLELFGIFVNVTTSVIVGASRKHSGEMRDEERRASERNKGF